MARTALMLVTANVGSIFEEPQFLLKSWMTEFLRKVQSLEPQFLALHCQEVGGKNYEESMKHVDHFVRSLVQSDELADFVHFKIFLDEDFTSTAKFTALGNLYFIHKSINNCQIWNFRDKVFESVVGQDIFSGSIEHVALKEKDKFPKDYFPDCKWSRKGFMRTRWKLAGSSFDLVNIHLFHDASNFKAMEEYPSFYTKVRRDALTYTLDRFENDEYETLPFFLFGDFNFRLNTGQVVRKIAKNISPVLIKHQETDRTERLLYRNSSDEDPFLTVEKKVFDLINQEDVFYVGDNRDWLLEDDSELESFRDRLLEQEIRFPPSYPFTEDMCGTTYMKTRCPSWCDRILFSHSAKALIADEESSQVEYEMLGSNVPMGDHKPIFLSFYLNTGNMARFSTRTSLEEHAEPDSEPLRCRTSSNPSIVRPLSKFNARRVRSLLPAETKTDTRSTQWLQATQALLRSLRLRESDRIQEPGSSDQPEPKQRVTRSSSRLTSHHSSSSEEWYSELQLLSEQPDQPDEESSLQLVARPVDHANDTENVAESASRSQVVATESGVNAESVDETRASARKRRRPCCHRCCMT